MTLAPETRVLLTDALRPPAGYRVEIAVGTTYSLNLTALLLAPLSFAVFDEAGSSDLGHVDPIRVLEAVRRHAEHTTVFCQAGGIHVPSNYRSILTFVEDSVLEVMPPQDGSIFHPKVWALRFIDQDDARFHRVIILSRNMTLDRSWDTALVLDEAENGAIDAAPAASFVRGLPPLALREMPAPRVAQIEDLATTLSQVRLAAPSPFTDGELLPMGMTDAPVWPFPPRARRLLAISPFLTKNALRAMAGIASDRIVVSRPEALEQVGSKVLGGWGVNVLQRLAEVEPDDDITEAAKALSEFQGTNEGLHAKTYVLDLDGGLSMTVTGSANLTASPWGGGVEFDAVLRGPTRECGIASVLDGSAEAPGLGALLAEYSVSEEEGAADAAIATSYELEGFHQQLALNTPVLHITPVDGERVEAGLTLTIPGDPPGETTVWLASLPGGGHRRGLADPLTWTLAPIHVTPFIAVETTAGAGDARVTRRCVLKATLTGAIDDRRHRAVFDILRSKQDVLRYLVFLLGDPSYDALFAQLAGLDVERYVDNPVPGPQNLEVALFEPLVRATGRDQDALARVASLVEELRELPNGRDLVPDGFEELWDVVWQVHRERRT